MIASRTIAILAVATGASLTAASTGACQQKAETTFTQPLTLGGVEVSPHTLNRGKAVYDRYCSNCHGSRGAGDGPGAKALTPRPASFAAARFRHATVDNPSALPSDDALLGLVRRGITGTGMPSWATLGNSDLRAVIHYIKTFSPRWRERQKAQQAQLQPSGASGSFRAALDPSVVEPVSYGAPRQSRLQGAVLLISKNSRHDR